jgi:hypothetical protein
MLAVQHPPGTKKSNNLRGVVCALMLTQVKVMVCSQSNSCGCEVSAKAVRYAATHHEQ